jgi:hypothetical protein
LCSSRTTSSHFSWRSQFYQTQNISSNCNFNFI